MVKKPTKKPSKLATAVTKQKPENRKAALDTALAHINKAFGNNAIMTMSAKAIDTTIETISTGALSLDLALGIGGLPRGRIIEIYGHESSGKTTLSLHCIAEAQKNGGVAAFIDAEHALDPQYAKAIGVDIDNLYLVQPDCGEQALEIAGILTRSGAVDIIVIDSVAALVPKQEIDGEIGDATVGVQARMMSKALRTLSGILNKSNTTLIFLNQMRMKIGGYGDPNTTAGGKALKFYASVRMEVKAADMLKQGETSIGRLTKVKVVKNKMAPPHCSAEFEIIFGKGISTLGCVIDTAIALDVVSRSGSWYSFGETKIGQGKESVRKYLSEHPEALAEVDRLSRERMNQFVATSNDDDLADDSTGLDFDDDDLLGLDD